MIRSSPPAQSEVVALLAELRALDVDPPAEAVRAMELAGDVERLSAPPDLAGWVARVDLSSVDAEAVMVALRRSVIQLRLADPAGRGLLRETVDALTARAVAALAADADRLIDAMRPGWDTAAAIVAAAAVTGIRSASTAADAISLGDDAATCWRTLPPALAVLDRLYRLRTDLLTLAGRALPPSVPNWVDASIGGPISFEVPKTRQEVVPA